MIVVAPIDPKAAGIKALKDALPLPTGDAEDRAGRKLLRRMDIKDALK